MDRWATITDLAERGVDVCDAERVEATIGDAHAYLACELSRAKLDAATLDGDLLRLVTCNLAKRALSTTVSNAYDQPYSQQAVGWSDTVTFSNPNGDMYLTRQERRLLGIRAHISSVSVL